MAVVSAAASGHVNDWQEFDVEWDTLHDEGTEGAHHARIARFLIDQRVDTVVAEHMGPGMIHMLTTMGIRVALGAHGDAKGGDSCRAGQRVVRPERSR